LSRNIGLGSIAVAHAAALRVVATPRTTAAPARVPGSRLPRSTEATTTTLSSANRAIPAPPTTPDA